MVSPLLFTMIRMLMNCILVLLLSATAFAEEKKTDVPVGDSPTLGPEDAAITLIEFIDFQ